MILAGGSVTNYFGLESVAERAWTMKDLSEAVALRSQVLHLFERAAREEDPERRQALLTFVVVGGGRPAWSLRRPWPSSSGRSSSRITPRSPLTRPE